MLKDSYVKEPKKTTPAAALDSQELSKKKRNFR